MRKWERLSLRRGHYPTVIFCEKKNNQWCSNATNGPAFYCFFFTLAFLLPLFKNKKNLSMSMGPAESNNYVSTVSQWRVCAHSFATRAIRSNLWVLLQFTSRTQSERMNFIYCVLAENSRRIVVLYIVRCLIQNVINWCYIVA